MNFERLEKRIMLDEGFSPTAYIDTVGVPTIGFGSTWLFGNKVTMSTSPIAMETAQIQLRADIYGAVISAHKIFPTLVQMDPVRQEVLVNMAYNLGSTRLRKFKKLRAAAESFDYTNMAREMVDSQWYTQVGGRGQRLVAAMKKGNWLNA